MKPKARGGLKVPPELIKEWETGDQNKLLDDFKKAGLDKDLFIKKATRRIHEHIEENDLWVDGEFMSEQQMKDEGFPEKRKRTTTTAESSDVSDADPLDVEPGSEWGMKEMADDVCKSLDSCADRISEVSSVGIASGYTHVQQDELKNIYMDCKKGCREALNLMSRAQPRGAGPLVRFMKQQSAKAPMRVLAEKTKALADEHGKSFAKNSMGSLGLSVANANQAFSRVVSKFHFTLKIPIATYVHAEGPATASLPYHSPTQLLSVLLEKYPWLLMGGCDQEECCRQLLLAFWDCYEQEHPEHEIFKQKNRDRLGKTIPLTMHGDGGRTQKKQPLEICSLQPVLGLNSASCASVSCHCPTSVKHGSGQFGDPLRQCLNSKHNTYMTHFLLFAYPSKSYKDFANLLHGLLQCVCDDLAEVCKSGIKTAGGRHYYFASVGFKLDMEWMAKIGSDTVVILKWLAFLLKLHLQEREDNFLDLLERQDGSEEVKEPLEDEEYSGEWSEQEEEPPPKYVGEGPGNVYVHRRAWVGQNLRPRALEEDEYSVRSRVTVAAAERAWTVDYCLYWHGHDPTILEDYDSPLKQTSGVFDAQYSRDSGAELLRSCVASEETVGRLPSRCVFNLFLARHCDKNPPWAKEPTKMELCTEEGFLRGEHLAREFGPHGPYPMPNRLFARKLNPGVYTSRDLYLLWPLAQKLGLRVNTSFGEEDAMTMVQSIEREREVKCLEGHSLETVLVSWDHCSIPALAQAWGCRQEPCMRCWDDGDFEKLLWLRFTATPAAADPREALSWNLTVAAVSEDFSAPRGVSGYRECLGNPAESSNYGFPCRAPPSWKSLSPNLTGRHGHQ
ncbi:Uncharacterized protein SCF082_LOCUS7258 [Durusdinium trenchii]|uniref:Uncharacterized protein n=1 Tax=Durusdinium trenchii TaxID=1381693 RepID=A0ABP0II19_9DINO